MKKWLALILAMILCLSLPSCAKDDAKDNDDELSANDSGNEEMTAVTIEERVIYDQNDVKVTVNGLKYSTSLGVTMELTVQNNRSEDFKITASDFSVNGLMIDALFYHDVAAGETAQADLYMTKKTLEISHITVIQTIEFRLRFVEPESYDTLFESNSIRLGTTADPDYQQPINDLGIVAYSDSNIRFIIQDIHEDKELKQQNVLVFIENNSQRTWTLLLDSFKVNGVEIDPVFSCEIPVGKKAYDFISISMDDLTEQNITRIDTLEFTLRVIDFDEYSNTYTTELIKVSS
jgi:hypothetical protein